MLITNIFSRHLISWRSHRSVPRNVTPLWYGLYVVIWQILTSVSKYVSSEFEVRRCGTVDCEQPCVNTSRTRPVLESVWSLKCDLGHPSKCGNGVTMCNDLSSSNYRSPAIVWLIPQHRRVISKIYIEFWNVNKTGAFGGRNWIYL